ncbi:hypothetical protein [Rhizobium phaseoli]|uniref:hypothetical protein n=1 Tax=Rhizobium phaseoli TaxID=396 RepID=UPI0007F04F14|nr:hypothetical protein [Rhizobium phaseoli]ANL39525.1 hypothetical protein AMC88_CH01096 [Rhizobium phaseoli]ANL58514.1 hypothetical protein AMC85_CH01096 [Rhizobium phaseoli]
MQTKTKLAGAAAVACVACCAFPIPALVASAVISGSMIAYWGAAALLIVLPLGTLFALSRRRTASPSPFNLFSANAEACGCGGACIPKAETPPAIACTLDAEDFKARTQWIEELSTAQLVKATRNGLTLSLTYKSSAFHAVQELVRKEQICCAFLDFDLSRDDGGVYLKITAPTDAAEAADLLFAHFVPQQNLTHLEPAQ